MPKAECLIGYKGNRNAKRDRDIALSRFQILSRRQRQVALFIAEGYDREQIAAMLNISIKTVDTHRQMALARLNVKTNSGLALMATVAKLIPAR